jgi:HEPN domain-containing protein
MVSEEEKSMNVIESFLRRARNKLDEAREHLKKFNYSESIPASQECIELSVKAIFLLFQEKYLRKHEFDEEEFEKILKMIPDRLIYLDLPKIYLYSKFWSQFYTITKYGLEKFGVGADRLFENEEVELALKHADRCEYAASQLLNYKKYGG